MLGFQFIMARRINLVGWLLAVILLLILLSTMGSSAKTWYRADLNYTCPITGLSDTVILPVNLTSAVTTGGTARWLYALGSATDIYYDVGTTISLVPATNYETNWFDSNTTTDISSALSGLAAYYPLDEASGTTVYDKAGSNIDGVSGATVGGAGRLFNDESFSAAAHNITLTDASGLLKFGASTLDFSVCLWGQVDSVAASGYAMSYEDGANDGWTIWYSTSNDHWEGRINSNAVAMAANSITDTNYHHICFTFDRDGNGTGYLDGAASGTPATVAGLTMTITTTAPRIGMRSYTGTGVFAGDIDDVQVWSRLLTAAEIASIYAAATTAGYTSTANCVAKTDAYWDGSYPMARYIEGYTGTAGAGFFAPINKTTSATLNGTQYWIYSILDAVDFNKVYYDDDSYVVSSNGVASCYFQTMPTISDGNSGTCADFSTGLVSYFPMDDVSGTIITDFGRGDYYGTSVGATINQSGKINTAAYVVTNDYIDVPAGAFATTAGALSVVLWAKMDAAAVPETPIVTMSVLELPTYYLSLGIANSNDRIQVKSGAGGPGGAYTCSSGVDIDDNWHQLAWVFNGVTTWNLYVDGALQTSTDSCPVGWANMTSVDTYTFGALRLSASSLYMAGKLDDVQMFSRALSTAEVLSMYSLSQSTRQMGLGSEQLADLHLHWNWTDLNTTITSRLYSDYCYTSSICSDNCSLLVNGTYYNLTTPDPDCDYDNLNHCGQIYFPADGNYSSITASCVRGPLTTTINDSSWIKEQFYCNSTPYITADTSCGVLNNTAYTITDTGAYKLNMSYTDMSDYSWFVMDYLAAQNMTFKLVRTQITGGINTTLNLTRTGTIGDIKTRMPLNNSVDCSYDTNLDLTFEVTDYANCQFTILNPTAATTFIALWTSPKWTYDNLLPAIIAIILTGGSFYILHKKSKKTS